MLRSLLVCVALVSLLAMADQAEARGRRGGCYGGSCGVSSGGCYGGSCGVTTSGCQNGQCQVSTTPAPSTPVVKSQPAPAQPATTVQSNYRSTTRYIGWRRGGRRFR